MYCVFDDIYEYVMKSVSLVIYVRIYFTCILARQKRMFARTVQGECRICGAKSTADDMASHLMQHTKTHGAGDVNQFAMRVDGGPDMPFWMYIQIPTEATFGVLDKFLRAVWVECCGHASEFEVDGEIVGMRKRLSAFCTDDTEFLYRYDMGSTTTLRLGVIGRMRKTMPMRGWFHKDAYYPPPLVYGEYKAFILALHNKVKFNCQTCGKRAVYVCSNCIYDMEGACCEDCAPKHECGDEMLLPVAQSPRVGVCSFEGGSLG